MRHSDHSVNDLGSGLLRVLNGTVSIKICLAPQDLAISCSVKRSLSRISLNVSGACEMHAIVKEALSELLLEHV